MLGFKQVVAGARQRIGAIFPRWGGGGFSRYSVVLPNARYDYETQAGDLWRSPVIAIGIKWLGDRFPRPIFRVSKIGRSGKYTPYGQHPLADLWNRPNEFYGRRTMEKAIGLSLIVDGNAYVQKVRNKGGEVVELWWLPHYRVFPTWPSDGSEFIDGYRVRIDGGNWWLPKEDVIHIKDGIDPYNERLGMSAVKSVLREVCTVNEESGYTASLLRNAGVPGMVIVPDDPSGKLKVTKEDADTIKARVREAFSGERRGDTLVMQGMFKVQTLGFSPEQLALDKLPVHAIARIAAAMGVAPMSLGLPDAGRTYSNLAEANRASWGTIQATQELVAETLRYQLLPDFLLDPQKNTPEYDYSEIQEMQESLDAIWRRVGQGFIDGVITRNEGRDLLGFPQDPEGDIYRPGTGGTAEPLVRENIAVTSTQPIGEQGVTDVNGKPVQGGKPAQPAPTQNGKPVNRIAAATATNGNGKPKRWQIAFDSLEEIEEKLEHFRNPDFSTAVIDVSPEAGQQQKYNHEHDSHGRFDFGEGGSSGNSPESAVHSGSGGGSGGGGVGEASVTEKPLSDKAKLAQQHYKKANAEEQRYAEHQETILAKGIGGTQSDDNRPVDVTVKGKGGVEHGIEAKTLVSGKNDKITMKDHAVAKKQAWLKEPGTKRELHTVVMDKRDKFGGGENAHLHSGHDLYYKRGVGAFRIGSMYKVKDHAELTKLLGMPTHKLPPSAIGPAR